MENNDTCFCPLINGDCEADDCMFWIEGEKEPLCLPWLIGESLYTIASKI